MRWRLGAVVLSVSLLTTLAAKPERIVDAVDRPVTIATMPCVNSLQATSSGFVYDDDLVVTVAHAIYGSRALAVRDATGRWHDGTVVHLDLERDLALVIVPDLAAVRMPTRIADRDEPVRMLGGAASGTVIGRVLRRVNITTEIVGDLSTDAQRSGYELAVPTKGGDSGAAVVDEDGNLVGVVFARSTRREAAWATSVSEIDEVITHRDVPSWECDPPVEAPLVLEPSDAEPRLP